MNKFLVLFSFLLMVPLNLSMAQQGVSEPKASASKSVKANAKSTNDEAGIKKTFTDFSQAWTAGDPKPLAAFWVKDGSLINPFGQDAWNRGDIEKLVGADVQMMKGSTQTFDDFKFRFILNFALVDCTATISGLKNADGTDAANRSFHIYAALALRDNRWYFLALRPYAFVPAPGAATANMTSSTSPSTTLPPASDASVAIPPLDAVNTPVVSAVTTAVVTPVVTPELPMPSGK